MENEKSELDKGLCTYENCPYFSKEREKPICTYETFIKNREILVKRYDKMSETYKRVGELFEDMREALEENLTKANEIISLLTYSWGY